MDLAWMGWTWQTGAFFGSIVLALIGMAIFSIKFPQAPKMGILRFETTPGDRLFMSLLGSAFICLGWLAMFGSPLWWALLVCCIYAFCVFRWV